MALPPSENRSNESYTSFWYQLKGPSRQPTINFHIDLSPECTQYYYTSDLRLKRIAQSLISTPPSFDLEEEKEEDQFQPPHESFPTIAPLQALVPGTWLSPIIKPNIKTTQNEDDDGEIASPKQEIIMTDPMLSNKVLPVPEFQEESSNIPTPVVNRSSKKHKKRNASSKGKLKKSNPNPIHLEPASKPPSNLPGPSQPTSKEHNPPKKEIRPPLTAVQNALPNMRTRNQIKVQTLHE